MCVTFCFIYSHVWYPSIGRLDCLHALTVTLAESQYGAARCTTCDLFVQACHQRNAVLSRHPVWCRRRHSTLFPSLRVLRRRHARVDGTIITPPPFLSLIFPAVVRPLLFACCFPEGCWEPGGFRGGVHYSQKVVGVVFFGSSWSPRCGCRELLLGQRSGIVVLDLALIVPRGTGRSVGRWGGLLHAPLPRFKGAYFCPFQRLSAGIFEVRSKGRNELGCSYSERIRYVSHEGT